MCASGLKATIAKIYSFTGWSDNGAQDLHVSRQADQLYCVENAPWLSVWGGRQQCVRFLSHTTLHDHIMWVHNPSNRELWTHERRWHLIWYQERTATRNAEHTQNDGTGMRPRFVNYWANVTKDFLSYPITLAK
jgi:hypothetical protein